MGPLLMSWDSFFEVRLENFSVEDFYKEMADMVAQTI